MTINKRYSRASEAVADIFDGATIMVGGFGSFGGLPVNLITALAEQGAKNLTVIANLGGVGFELTKRIKPGGYQDLGILFERGDLANWGRPGRPATGIGGGMDLAVIEVGKARLLLKEMAPGWTLEDIQGLTEARLIPAADLREIEL